MCLCQILMLNLCLPAIVRDTGAIYNYIVIAWPCACGRAPVSLRGLPFFQASDLFDCFWAVSEMKTLKSSLFYELRKVVSKVSRVIIRRNIGDDSKNTRIICCCCHFINTEKSFDDVIYGNSEDEATTFWFSRDVSWRRMEEETSSAKQTKFCQRTQKNKIERLTYFGIHLCDI